jgi:hypothetical protein
MSKQGWVETLIASQIDSTPVSNTTTPTSILPPSARFTLPANFFSEAGKALRVRAIGRISTLVTSPGTITFALWFGTIASPIAVFSGGATSLNIVAQTNAQWWLDLIWTCRAIGNGTNANGLGTAQWTSRASLNAPAVGTTTGVGSVLLPDTAPAVGTGFDSTITNVVDLSVAFSVANASNSITTHQFNLESLN